MLAKTHALSESFPQSHYDSSTGKWDGQLPVAGILSQVPENWPSASSSGIPSLTWQW